MNPKRIFISGPYCPRDCDLHEAARIAQYNVDQAISIANALLDKGHYPFVPHLTHYIHTHHTSTKARGDLWYKLDDTFLYYWAEALYYISPSPGADHELDLAKNLGLIIYYSLEEVPEVK